MTLLGVSKTSAARPSYMSSMTSKALEWRGMFEQAFIRKVYRVSVCASLEAPYVSITKTARLMLCISHDIR